MSDFKKNPTDLKKPPENDMIIEFERMMNDIGVRFVTVECYEDDKSL